MRLRPFLLNIGCIFSLFIVGTLAGPSRSFASDESWGVPAWLRAHIGEGEDDIAPIVLQRARALYLQKVHEGAVRNSCYFAMDATRPNDMGGSGHRFYVICESSQSFRAISAGQEAVFTRAFLQFDGEGETANARERRVGGHAAVALKGLCLMKRPSSPYADQDGYVPRGTLVEYSGGRSDGCTSWTPSDARQIMSMVRDDPTTLYIYPDAADIRAAARGGSYWNASCLREIGSPRFWSRETLEPLLAEYKQAHPAPPPRPIPICKGP
ncbi:MAG TPA: hypothetical protein VGB93_05505 [Methylovirgula sp.]